MSIKKVNFMTENGIIEIPETELAPGAMFVELNGVETWIDGDKVKLRDEFVHESISDEWVKEIVKIKDRLDEVYSLPLQDWIDGFRRDNDYKSEVINWLKICQTYEFFTKDIVDFSTKREIFKISVISMSTPEDQILRIIGTSSILPETIKAIHKYYANGILE